jgi:hypothetical protein|tara:strand:- start:3139 stop:3726 length:588 start_codon:yes stop_codon:yes gene_type:complete
MAFWSEDFGQKGTIIKDPKRGFRFKVEFQGIQDPQGGAILWMAKSCTKPSFTISTSEHKFLNHTFHYPGSVTWNDITVGLVDPVEPDMAATISDIIEKSGYSPPTDSHSLGSMSKGKAAGALGKVIITQIDGDGGAVETWTLWNSFISDVKYGDLAYGTDDLTEISLTLKYDWARLETVGTSAQVDGGGNEFFGV